ncbi:MAG TPA: hypothetical protein VJC12_02845 [Candidatus Paceibacterota bacterium]
MGGPETPKYEPTPEEQADALNSLSIRQGRESGQRLVAAGREDIDELTRKLLDDENIKIGMETGPDGYSYIMGTINGKGVNIRQPDRDQVVRGTIDGIEIADGSEAIRLWEKYERVAALSSVDSKQKERREKEAQSFDL